MKRTALTITLALLALPSSALAAAPAARHHHATAHIAVIAPAGHRVFEASADGGLFRVALRRPATRAASRTRASVTGGAAFAPPVFVAHIAGSGPR